MKKNLFFWTTSYTGLRSENDGTVRPGSAQHQQDLRTQEWTRVLGEEGALPSQGEEGDGTKSSSVLCTPLGWMGASLPGPAAGGPAQVVVPPEPPIQPGHPTTQKSLGGPLSCQVRNTNPNWTQTQIKERHTQREGPSGPSRSLASRRDTFLWNSGTEALGPLWGLGVKKYGDSSLPAGSRQGRGRPDLNFFSSWFHIGPFPGAGAEAPPPPRPRAPPPAPGWAAAGGGRAG